MRNVIHALLLGLATTALAPPLRAQTGDAAAATLPAFAVVAGLLPAAGGGLRLEEVAFDTGGSELTHDAFRALADAGRALHRLGADPLHVVIYTDTASAVVARRASLRAVSVARALTRGGYPAGA
ncbi:MAG TPA: hypothetical protein VF832_04690, partial [Longimicrobiales bacterium]